MSDKNKFFQSGDNVIRQGTVRAYNTDSGLADGEPLNVPATLPSGYPLQGGVPLSSTALNAGGNVTSILLNQTRLEPSQVLPVAVVVRGKGLVVNRDALPQRGWDGGAFDMDVFQTRIEELGFVVYEEPEVQMTQAK